MNSSGELFTIGQLARRSGVPARTVRFWTDAGLVPVAVRSAAGYRLYDAEAVARLGLVRSLRELGFGLDVVRAVLSRAVTVADLAAAQVTALDAQIRTLRLRRAVLSTVARRSGTIEETMLMHKLARLSAQERQQMIDAFVREVFDGVDPEAPAAGIARNMRRLPAELPDDPDPQQVDAWIELGELISDESFRQRVRGMAAAGAQAAVPEPGLDHSAVAGLAGQALAAGIAPESAEGQQVLDCLVAPGTPPEQRARLQAQLETFADSRVERYWQLQAVINGRQPQPPVVPSYEWVIAALRDQSRGHHRPTCEQPPASGRRS
jgi:DNA-binding transcriptional MerR regulator